MRKSGPGHPSPSPAPSGAAAMSRVPRRGLRRPLTRTPSRMQAAPTTGYQRPSCSARARRQAALPWRPFLLHGPGYPDLPRVSLFQMGDDVTRIRNRRAAARPDARAPRRSCRLPRGSQALPVRPRVALDSEFRVRVSAAREPCTVARQDPERGPGQGTAIVVLHLQLGAQS